ncbi:protein kinase [Trypanosoma brucei equiperdum]|uniref:Protein kinase n=1 Tax=Trypanosoma brucei equiperdum TaxID=630700 RepID=A0A3L6LBP2_9TRYP|nr:protein kinase [Trypanosoma brucei equiperdum]
MSPSKGEHLKLSAGDLIDNRFEVLEEVGCGNFSKVYYCFGTPKAGGVRRQPVAVKVVKKEYKNDAYFEQEMLQILSQKKNGRASVCQMLEFFEWKGYPVFVMKIYGPSLRKRRLGYANGVVTREKVVQVAHSLLETCRFIHIDCRMVHTDLKPENILLENITTSKSSIGDNWVVCDFGSSSLWRMDHLDSDLITTRPYRAPEVVLGNPWYHPADMWSVGCIIFELAIGRRLFDVRDDLTHLQLMERCLGPLPDLFRRRSKNSRSFFDQNGNFLRDCDDVILGRMRSRTLAELLPGDTELCDLIASMLVYDPESRATAEEALKHRIFKQPFILSNSTASNKRSNTPARGGNPIKKLATPRATSSIRVKATVGSGNAKEAQNGQPAVRIPVCDKVTPTSSHNKSIDGDGATDTKWSRPIENVNRKFCEPAHAQGLPALEQPTSTRHPSSSTVCGKSVTDSKHISQQPMEVETAYDRKPFETSVAVLQSSKSNTSSVVISSVPSFAKEGERKKGRNGPVATLRNGTDCDRSLPQNTLVELLPTTPSADAGSQPGMTSSPGRQADVSCGSNPSPVIAHPTKTIPTKEKGCVRESHKELSISRDLECVPPSKHTTYGKETVGALDEYQLGTGAGTDVNAEASPTSTEGALTTFEKTPTDAAEAYERLASSTPSTMKGKESSKRKQREPVSMRSPSKPDHVSATVFDTGRMVTEAPFPPHCSTVVEPRGDSSTNKGVPAPFSLSGEAYFVAFPHVGGPVVHTSHETILPNIAKDQRHHLAPFTPRQQQQRPYEPKTLRSPPPASVGQPTLQRINTVYATTSGNKMFPSEMYGRGDAGRPSNRQSSTPTTTQGRSSTVSASEVGRNSRQNSTSLSESCKNLYQLSRLQAVPAFKAKDHPSPPQQVAYVTGKRRIVNSNSQVSVSVSAQGSTGSSAKAPRKSVGAKEMLGDTHGNRQSITGSRDVRRRVVSSYSTVNEGNIRRKGTSAQQDNMDERVNLITGNIADFIGISSARGKTKPSMEGGSNYHPAHIPYPPSSEAHGKRK